MDTQHPSWRLAEHHHAPHPGLYGRWVVACALAEALGLGAAAAAAASGAGAGAVLAAGALEGALLGVLQARVLRPELPTLRTGEWALPTALAAVALWAAGGAASAGLAAGAGADGGEGVALPPGALLAAAALLGLGAGAVLGGVQALVLRHHAERSGAWVRANALGWALGMPAVFVAAALPEAHWPLAAVAAAGAAGGLAAGALLGAVTGGVVHALEPWVELPHGALLGRVCVVTGATSGIGHEVARALVHAGATVVLPCRDGPAGERCAAALRREGGAHADVRVVACDLTSRASVRGAAATLRARFRRVDALVHAAGATAWRRALTEDGLERTWATDVAGPLALTLGLREPLEHAGGRVVWLAGASQRRGRVDVQDLHFERRRYGRGRANAQAQRARVVLAAELAWRTPRLSAVAVHPGAVRTRGLPLLARVLAATLLRPGYVRAELGALPVLRLVAQEDLRRESGRFFHRFRLTRQRVDVREGSRVWEAAAPPAGALR